MNSNRSLTLLARFCGLLLLALPLPSPALTATASPGQAITFSVTAEGDQPFSYRWFKDGIELPGATGAEHVLGSATLADAGTYVAEVRNAAGATLSDAAILSVAPIETAPVITSSPVSQTVFAGATVTFSATASGSPAPTYQWRKDGNPVMGATANTLTIAAAALSDAGTYTVTATNSAGSATSAPAVLTVNPPLTAPVFTLQPVSQNVIEGGSIAFTAAASGNPTPAYQWYQDGNAIAAATSASYGITNAVAGSAGAYTVVAQNSVGSTTSAIALLTVSPATYAPVITTQPVSRNVTAGANVTFTVVASGNPSPSYRWFVQVKSGRRVTKTYLAGATNPSLTLGNVTTTDAGTYAVDVANSAGTVTSAGAVLKVTTTSSKGPKSQTNLVNGTTVATALPGRFADTLRVDFNADGRADLVFHHLPSGGVKAWLLRDAARTTELGLPSPGKAWRLATAADFNGDGRADLVWQNPAAGTAEIQLLAGSERIGTVSFSEIPASWQLAAAGDFTGDALPDLVFQDVVTGERNVLALTRLKTDGLRALPPLPIEWDIAGAGDFNADGSTDLLLENLLTGEYQLWLLRGTTSLGRLSLGRPGPLWVPAGATDLNGDARSDILWEHPVTGERLAWLLPVTGAPVAVPLGRENPGWTLAH
ncbi:MAG: hypothetical protein FJ397_05390 [Verrucomicrobia bacterium]|nr:hypothetical protein [Verrucomicrobiota bacterium]